MLDGFGLGLGLVLGLGLGLPVGWGCLMLDGRLAAVIGVSEARRYKGTPQRTGALRLSAPAKGQAISRTGLLNLTSNQVLVVDGTLLASTNIAD